MIETFLLYHNHPSRILQGKIWGEHKFISKTPAMCITKFTHSKSIQITIVKLDDYADLLSTVLYSYNDNVTIMSGQ